MNWFKGSIQEAVAQSKMKNAVFVVFVKGKDTETEKMSQFIDNERIRDKLEADDFVAIKIDSDSQAYVQFASIYQVVPVPSLFFIGKNGTPVEICTSIINSVEELSTKIEKVLVLSPRGNTSATTSGDVASEPVIASTSASASTSKKEKIDEEIVCDGDVCYKQVNDNTKTDPDEAVTTTSKNSVEKTDKTASEENNAQFRAQRKTMEEDRMKRMQKEKERKQRNNTEPEDPEQRNKSEELSKLKESLRRERQKEQQARDRVLAQIAGDRAALAEKSALAQEVAAATTTGEVSSTSPNTASSPSPTRIEYDQTRLQFRLPDGHNRTQSFQCKDTLGIARTFVKNEMLPGTGIRDFALVTAFPKREFTKTDEKVTLKELGLAPNAVVFIIAKETAHTASIIARSTGGLFNMLNTVFWFMLWPMVSAFGFVKKSFGFGPAENNKRNDAPAGADETPPAKRRNIDRYMTGPSTSKAAGEQYSSFPGNSNGGDNKPYRRFGGPNIHRLSDKRPDSDDDNATWNGNSTQQQ